MVETFEVCRWSMVDGHLAWTGLGCGGGAGYQLGLTDTTWGKESQKLRTLWRSSPGGQDDLTRDDIQIPVGAILARVYFTLYAWLCRQSSFS